MSGQGHDATSVSEAELLRANQEAEEGDSSAVPLPIPLGTLGAAGAGSGRPRIAMLVHPKMVLQDLIGPLTVFNLLRSEIHLVWKDLCPVSSEVGIPVTPSTTFETCPTELDVLFVPGGLDGTIAAMQDDDVIGFVANRGASSRFVTSDCTGSLLLGAAGLLHGYRAASHWTVRHLVSEFGAIPSADRVCIDRNRITGGGVTAGIDFALTLASFLRGRAEAEAIELTIEYAPEPPFGAGRPDIAPLATVERITTARAAIVERARTASVLANNRAPAPAVGLVEISNYGFL